MRASSRFDQWTNQIARFEARFQNTSNSYKRPIKPLFIYQNERLAFMVKQQTLIISTVSTVVLILATSVSIYFYMSYARPETVDPKRFENDLNSRSEKLNEALASLMKKYIPYRELEKIDTKVVQQEMTKGLDVDIKVKENEVKKVFKDVLAKKEDVPATENKVEESIEPITFTPIAKKTTETALSKEIEDPKLIYKGQVGLNLATDNFFSAVYQIKNAIGVPGLIGHFFVMSSKHNWKKPFSFNDINADFSSLDELKKLLTETSVKGNYKNLYMDTIHANVNHGKLHEAVIPEIIEGKSLTNPYKWLHLSTEIMSEFHENNDPVYAFVYSGATYENYKKNEKAKADEESKSAGKPQENGEIKTGEQEQELKEEPTELETAYPDDVNVFKFDWMANADRALYSGCIKRILNHCKDYLTELENIKI